MHIPVTDQISPTEFRPSDKTASVERIGDQDIYDRTLRIPHPYSEAHFDQWLGIVAEATEQHGEPVHFAIREGDSLIGGIGGRHFAFSEAVAKIACTSLKLPGLTKW